MTTVAARLSKEERVNFLTENKEVILDGVRSRSQYHLVKTFTTKLMEVVTGNSFYMDNANSPDESIDFDMIMDKVSEDVVNSTYGHDVNFKVDQAFEDLKAESTMNQRGSSMR